MAVQKHLVSNWDQAIEYMKGSALAASKGVCSSAASVYNAFAVGYDTSKRLGGTFSRQDFLDDLASADAACTTALDPSTGGAVPEDIVIVPAAIGAGLPWWVWLIGGGAALYFLFGKKKGKK